MVEITYQMVLSTRQTADILVDIIYYIAIMRNSQRTQQMHVCSPHSMYDDAWNPEES